MVICDDCVTNAKIFLYYSVLCLGFVAHMIVLCPLIRFIKSPTFAHPFYRIALSHSICDVYGLLSKLVSMIAYPLFGTDALWGLLIGFWNAHTWNCALFHQVLIAVNRFVTLTFPGKQHKLFNNKRQLLWILFVWISSAALIAPMLTSTYAYVYLGGLSVALNTSVPESVLYNKIRSGGVQSTLDVAILLLYVGCAMRVYKTHKKVEGTLNHENAMARKSYRMEIRLLLIGALAAIPQAICVAVNQIVFYVPLSSDVSSFLSFLAILLSLINHSISPYIYMKFSSEFRTKIVEMYLTDAQSATNGYGSDLKLPSIRINYSGQSQSRQEGPSGSVFGASSADASESRIRSRLPSEVQS